MWEVTLDEASVQKAIDGLEDYKRELDRKCETLRQRVAEVMSKTAQHGFDGAIVDDYTEITQDKLGIGPKKASVSVSVTREGNAMLVIASGQDAVFVEFGAGVTHNGSVGHSPNPLAEENGLPFKIGSHGEKGADPKWAFKDKGVKYWTYGTPAGMPMYRAVMAVAPQIADIAREVFGA